MSRVFISYSHKDVARVKAVASGLASRKILLWFDEKSIQSGDKWQVNIATAISSCDVFLLFNSQNYLASEYCRKELYLAKQKRGHTAFIIVDLDDSRTSFVDNELTQYQQIAAKDMKDDVLLETLLLEEHIRHCSVLGVPKEIIDGGTTFLNAIGNLSNPSHHNVLEPFLEFLSRVCDDERNGKYISKLATFSSFIANKVNGGGLSFSLIGANDYTSDPSASNATVFLKNVMRVLFGLCNCEFQQDVADSIDFATPFWRKSHRFMREIDNCEGGIYEKVYAYLNEQIWIAYTTFASVDELIDRLYEVCEASKFFESLESRYGYPGERDYEITDDVLKVARMLFACNFGNEKLCDECIPNLIHQESGKTLTFKQLLDRSENKVFLHTGYGCGTSSLLKKCFEYDENCFYIDLANHGREGKNMLIRHLCENDALAYRLNFYKLFNYSAVERKITLLIDNFDLLSDENRQFVISDLVEYGDAFNVVFASSNINVDSKLALTQNQGILADYTTYRIASLDKARFVAYIGYKLTQKGLDGSVVAEQFATLDDNDEIFEIFDSFTKINLLVDIVNDTESFSVLEVKEEFDSRIKVYQNLFESNNEYSIPHKISSLFKHNVVDIEDVIIEIVRGELNALKKVSYYSHSITGEISVENNRFRFRDFYPILNRITSKYYFLNEDIRSYLSASYVMDCVNDNPNDFDELRALLMPIEKEYSVLKYLKEFDILSKIDLKILLSSPSYEDVVLVLFKVLQYYELGAIKKVFLQNAQFETLPDKFFMGAENIIKIVVPSCVREVGRAVFSNAPLLECIDFAPKVKNENTTDVLKIKPWAIINCPRLEKIRLPESYQSYKHPLASRCDALKYLELVGDNPCFATLSNGAMLVSKDMTRLYFTTNALCGVVVIPSCITTLETNCLSYLKHVTEYVLPSSIISAETNFSDFCDKLERITIDKENPIFASDEKGYMYTRDKKTLFRVPSGVKDDVVIPSGVEIIGSDSISCCRYTKRIYVPKDVLVVENYAFADTYSLLLLEFEDLSEIEELGNYIFLSTNEYVKIRAGKDYSLKSFNEHYLKHMSREKNKGQAERTLTFEDFSSRGIEILHMGTLEDKYSNLAVVRDITLFNKVVYDPEDFNVMLIGMTEYNAIMSKDLISADAYVEELIGRNHIRAVLFSRDLPILSQFEDGKHPEISVFRTSKSSTSAAKLLSDVIISIGGYK